MRWSHRCKEAVVRTDYELLNESLGLVAPVADQLIASFYDRVFTEHPQVRAMFPADMTQQRENLLKAVVALVTNYDHREDLVPYLEALGGRHVRYGVVPEHYGIIGQALLASLAHIAGEHWTDEYEGAWARAYTFAAEVMQSGASGTAVSTSDMADAA
jgi:hemoglobin-like flavoprotein